MPTVPRFDTPQVAPAGPSNARFDAPQAQNFAPRQAMQMGQAVENAGGELARIVAINEEENIRASAKNRNTQALQAFNGLQHDPDSGYFNQQGKAAVDGYRSAVEAAQKISSDTLNAATNPREKEILEPLLAERMNATALALTKHYNAERNRWRLQSSQDHAEVALRDAASTPADPTAFTKALDTAHFEVEEQARLNGWDESTIRTSVPAGVAAAGGEYLAGGQKIGAKDLARMLPGARLQTFGDGSYLVRAGSDIVRRADGSPFVLKVGR